jgi:hypothetical protein
MRGFQTKVHVTLVTQCFSGNLAGRNAQFPPATLQSHAILADRAGLSARFHRWSVMVSCKRAVCSTIQITAFAKTCRSPTPAKKSPGGRNERRRCKEESPICVPGLSNWIFFCQQCAATHSREAIRTLSLLLWLSGCDAGVYTVEVLI